jgi:hypothetical protein
VLAAALVGWAAMLALAAAVTQRALFCVLLLAAIGVGGLVDVSMNVAATSALGNEPRRLLRAHGLFNAGSLIGAGCMGVVLAAGGSFRVAWIAIAALALCFAAWVRASELPAGERGEHYTVTDGMRALVRGGLVVLAVVFALGAVVEGGVGTWGVLFLRSRLGLATIAGAGAYVAGQALATVARMTLGGAAYRLGQRRGAQVGLGLAGAGLLLEATATHALPAAIGLAMATVGSATYWPRLLAHASMGSERPGIVVGGLSAAGYVGFLAGPPLVGWISQATDLRWGIAVLGAAAVAGATLPLRQRSVVAAT